MKKRFFSASILLLTSFLLQSGCVPEEETSQPSHMTTVSDNSVRINDNGTGDIENYGTVPAHVITTNTVWEDVFEDPFMVDYVVNTHVLVSSGIFTIKPGVRIQFANNKSLQVNENCNLNIVGTQVKNILLEGQIATPTWWEGINTRTSGAIIKYANISHADIGIKASRDVSILNSTVQHCAIYGVQLLNGASLTNFTTNTIAYCGTPMDIPMPAVNQISASTQFVGNTNNRIEVNSVDGLNQNVTFSALSIPYLMKGNNLNEFLIMKGNTINNVTCTFAPAAILEMTPGLYIQCKNGASIKAIGTPTQKVVFRSKAGTTGRWNGFVLNNNISTDYQFDHCIFDGGGGVSGYSGMLNFVHGGSVINSQFNNSGHCGIYTASPGSLTQNNNTFIDIPVGNICQ